MLKPSVELTRDLDISTYSLVVGLAKKAREIVDEAEQEHQKGEKADQKPIVKPVEQAVQMYKHHDFKIVETEPCPVCGRLDCICEKRSEADDISDTLIAEGE